MSATFAIDPRFCGPPDSGNGGYVAGRFAREVGDGPLEVTLRRPPPLDRPLGVEREGEDWQLRDGDAVVAQARRVGPPEVPAVAVDLATARAASGRCPFLVHPEWHPFPTCFVCGPDRAEGDGLRLFPGPVGPSEYATTWVPGDDLADGGRVRSELVWAALDCPSSLGIYETAELGPDGAYVLGRIASRIEELPRAGEELVVASWRLGRDGRKLFAASALARPGGAVLAAARATWIRI